MKKFLWKMLENTIEFFRVLVISVLTVAGLIVLFGGIGLVLLSIPLLLSLGISTVLSVVLGIVGMIIGMAIVTGMLELGKELIWV